ncbi:hypothetical protein B0J15DRAFT_509767 [Fusarium solani]|uniref:ABC transporter domain-containing protein n=1 Tax=Fusarium solani TaxID=169388 RepID=A0A9P9L007_FUSSL|nr:uncharacterized protein B0J15DRAFT_509767 [Fusarium solani]KAH7271712.1 hypothetical protein B0J15DRAFT_509767 [Fusarium solani]
MNELEHNDSDWALKPKVAAFKERDRSSGFPDRELGVTWQNLNVEVITADAAIHENVVSQFNIPKLVKESRHKPPLKAILDNSHGCVKPGEMLLVLGRPGSGCTTLLNMIANHRRGYASVSGDVHYGSMTAEEAKNYRGQIVMNTEEELFFPSLTVGQTMDFATRLKVPFQLPDGVTSAEEMRVETRDFLLQSMGIEHTHDTKVGNAFIRGVSGGERKRVPCFCWDNSTRGLDASTALEYTKAIRAMTDVLGLASIVTLYQAGNGIYDLFDKVLVLDEGKEVYYGPLKEARPFMESMGFICQHGANVADYLTGVTVPTERDVRPEFENRFPRNADMLRVEYEKSPIYQRMIAETRLFKEGVRQEKDKKLADKDPMTVGFIQQVKACVQRQYQILLGDKATFIIKQVSTIIQALIAGSLFYNAPILLVVCSSSLVLASSPSCFNSLLSMSEVTDSFTGRPVLLKHKSFAFFHPAAFCIAQITADIPVILFQVSTFSIILYFMVGLTSSAGAFFTFWVILVAITMCMTALFRAVGAGFSTFDGASKMHPWFVWIFWINPMAYGFDALLSNEFHNKIIPCVGPNLVPSGPSFNNADHQACAGVGGARPGQNFVTGDDYLASLSYSHSHLWRNFGIVWAWWALFVAITVIATSKWHNASEDGPSLLIPRENAHVTAALRQADEEGQVSEKKAASNRDGVVADDTGSNSDREDLVRNTSVFTWKNLTYTVKTPSGDRTLLDNVQGWVKPGMLGALMGASGAGKTTLLDVLAQRKTEGTIHGSIMVDGRPLPVSFQRSAGYCEQLDVHEPFATVREALEFSALLRQSRDTPREEKLKYVDTIIDLLELHDLADTLIGEVGAGLSVEQRKRVTIGVELSAYNTVRFLRKLAGVGQAVLVTIHQPSAQLFAQFDTLLLLARAKTVREYFGRYGAPCPQDGKDWNQVWLSSPEHEAVERNSINHLGCCFQAPGTVDDGNEFATVCWSRSDLLPAHELSLYRNTDYINNKLILHITSAYSTVSHSGTLALPSVSFSLSFPYLVLCAVFYYVCWYYTVGFPDDASRAGSTFFVMLMYEFVYTGIGQFVAAYAPNEVFASLVNPSSWVPCLFLWCVGALPADPGILAVLDVLAQPFNYLMGSMLVFDIWGSDIKCSEKEFARFDPPNGTTCGEYLEDYLGQGLGMISNLVNPDATSECKVCSYTKGEDYLRTLNLKEYYYGWRDAAIVVIFAISSYALVYVLMKLRTKTSKKAE